GNGAAQRGTGSIYLYLPKNISPSTDPSGVLFS
ncbi:unnamed protein product, partial [marine sediment metagenome]